MDKKCYCINPSCKCLFGCGCTLADKSVGKCMCCIMEETNQKIDKLRRKKITTTLLGGNSGGSQCKCNLGKNRFYDIIVVDENKNYVSCRYECSVEIIDFSEVEADWKGEDAYITDEYISGLGEKNVTINYGSEITTYGEPKLAEGKYLLLFIKKTTLEYAVFCTTSINSKLADV